MTGDEQQQQSDQLKFLRQVTGAAAAEANKPMAGAATNGKSAEELYAEEMEFLAKGGADYSGQQRLRDAFARLGRMS